MLRSLGLSSISSNPADDILVTANAEDTEKLLSTDTNANIATSATHSHEHLVFHEKQLDDNPITMEDVVLFDGAATGGGVLFDFKACDHRVLIYTTCYNVIDGYVLYDTYAYTLYILFMYGCMYLT